MDRHEVVRLGLMPPLTGIVGLYGDEISRAGEIATQIVNARGGVLGRRLELVLEDDGSIPLTAVPAAERLIDEHGCAAIIGNLLSSSRIAVASQVAARRRIPYLNFSFSEGSISEPFFFHFAALPNQQIDKMIPFMAENFGAKMYFAGHDYEWPRGSIDAAKRALHRVGGESVGEEYVAMGSELAPLLERIASSGADVLVPYFAGSDQQKLLTLFTEHDLKQRMQVVMGHCDEALVSTLAPEVREGLYSSNTYFMSLETAENAEYLRRLARHPGVTGIWPNGNGLLTNFGEGAYLCVLAFAKAVNLAGTIDPEAVAEALATVEVRGPQGLVVMDPRTRHAAVNTYLARCRPDGTFEIVRSFGRAAPELPARYAVDVEATDGPQSETSPLRLVRHRAGEHEGEASRGEVLVEDRLTPGATAVFARGRPEPANGSLQLADAREPYGKLIVGSDGVIELANERLTTLAGYPAASGCRGRHAAGLWSSDMPWEAMARAASSVDVWIGEARLLAVSGQKIPCRVAIQPMRELGGPVLALSALLAPSDDVEACTAITKRATATSGSGILRVDQASGAILDANEAAARQLGYEPAELVGRSLEEIFSPAYRRVATGRARSIAHATGWTSSLEPREMAAYRKDGSELAAEAAFSPLRHCADRQLVVMIRNIDDARRAARLATWRATHDPVTGLPNAVLIQERVNSALARSKRTQLHVGVLFVRVWIACHGAERDEVIRSFGRRVARAVRAGDTVGRTGDTELVIVCERMRDDAELRSLGDAVGRALESPLETECGRCAVTASVTAVLGRGSTLEALRAVGAELQSSEERYRSLVESSPHGILECDAAGIVTLANDAYARMHGLADREHVTGRGVWAYVDDQAAAERLRASVARWMAGDRSEPRHLVRERRADGSPIDVQLDWESKRDVSGRPVGLVAIATDVTSQLRAARELRELNDSLEERVRQRTADLESLTARLQANIAEREVVERELRVSEERFRGVFEQSTDGILLVGSDERIFDVNPVIVSLLGIPRAALVGMPISHLFGSNDFVKRYRAVVAGHSSSVEEELRHARKDRDDVWVRVRAGAVRDAMRTFVFAFVLVQDITRAKALEEQRALVTRELDHRVKNNLTAILALLTQSSKSSATKEELVASFGDRLRGMARLHELLARSCWNEVSLRTTLDTVLAPFASAPETFRLHGPELTIPATLAMPLGMAISELTSNAAKYGALATPGNRVDVEWRLEPSAKRICLAWREHAGRPITRGRAGMGTRIVNGLVRHELGGEASCCFEPEGVHWQFSIPLSRGGNEQERQSKGEARCEF